VRPLRRCCDGIMKSLKRPLGLIRTATHHELETGQKPRRLRPRPVLYGLGLVTLITVLVMVVGGRDPVQITVVRQPGAAYSQMPDGKLANLFQVRLVNRRDEAIPLNFTVLNKAPVVVTCSSCNEPLKPYEERRLLVVLSFDQQVFKEHRVALQLDATGSVSEIPIIHP